MSSSAWVDGRLVDALAPAVAPLDQGFALGLAVFETLLHEDRCVYFLEEHLERLRSGAQMLRIPWPPPHSPGEGVRALARALDGEDAALRITLSRGVPGGAPVTVVTARDVERRPPEGITLAISEAAKLGTAPTESVKSTNRARNVLAFEDARGAGADEALLPTEEGDLSEGTRTNLFVARGGRVVTPGLDRGCLAGIVREKVLGLFAEGPVVAGGRRFSAVEARVGPADLEEADEVFLTSTLGRVIAVRRILGIGREYPGGEGVLTAELRRRVRELEDRYRRDHPL